MAISQNIQSKLLFIFLVPLLFFSACLKQRMHVTSNSFADTQAIPYGFIEGRSFAILPTKQNNTKQDNQLLTKEVSRKIESILKENGYAVADSEFADYLLMFNYEMTSAVSSTMVPVYTPGEVKNKQGTVYGAGRSTYYQEETQSSGTLAYVQQYYTVYHKTLVVKVIDAAVYREAKREEELWQGSATSCGKNSNLRGSLDYLLLSVFKCFGENVNNLNETYQYD